MELHLRAAEYHLPYGSHSVTFHPTQVNRPRLNHSQILTKEMRTEGYKYWCRKM